MRGKPGISKSFKIPEKRQIIWTSEDPVNFSGGRGPMRNFSFKFRHEYGVWGGVGLGGSNL